VDGFASVLESAWYQFGPCRLFTIDASAAHDCYTSVHAHDRAEQLQTGIKTYWVVTVAVLAITRSSSFVFWVILEPLLCMSYFLALINIGFHGFIEYDAQGTLWEALDVTTLTVT
jgi:hypothetical protein